MSLIRLGFWAASGASAAVTYWLATLGGASVEYGFSVATDSSNSSYQFGNTESTGAGSADFLLAKRDTLGAVQWQRTLGGASSEAGSATAIDSSDNVYVFGNTLSEGPGNTSLVLAKYNSSGAIQWQRILGDTGAELGRGIAIDVSDNIYLAGSTVSEGAGLSDFFLAKYNTSGTIQWQRILGGAGADDAQAVATDSAGNVYIAGYSTSSGAGSYDFLFAKYNSSGTIQWQRTLGGTDMEFCRGLTIDSSDNIYLSGETDPGAGGGDDFLVAKYNSSGTIQWQRTLGGSGTDDGHGIVVDSSDNVYVFGDSNSEGEGSDDFVIAKYNSSGTIQWQRILGSTGLEFAYSVAIDSSETLNLSGLTNGTGEGSFDFLLAKVPNDGSLTGTYVLDGVDFVYAASTLTAATSTLTSATSSLTAATSTLTSSTSTLTDSSASLTSHFVEIPA